jgi:hypothetical protein
MSERAGSVVSTRLSQRLRRRGVRLDCATAPYPLDEAAIASDSIDAMFHEVPDGFRFADIGMGKQP